MFVLDRYIYNVVFYSFSFESIYPNTSEMFAWGGCVGDRSLLIFFIVSNFDTYQPERASVIEGQIQIQAVF